MLFKNISTSGIKDIRDNNTLFYVIKYKNNIMIMLFKNISISGIKKITTLSFMSSNTRTIVCTYTTKYIKCSFQITWISHMHLNFSF